MTRGYRSWFQDLINVWTMPATVLKNKVMYRQFVQRRFCKLKMLYLFKNLVSLLPGHASYLVLLTQKKCENYWCRLNSDDVYVLWGLHRITNCAVYLSAWRCRTRRKPRAYRLEGSWTLFIVLWLKSVGENTDDVCLHRTTQTQKK